MRSYDLDKVTRIINGYAARVKRRLVGAGDHTTSIDDIKQEAWIGWALACDSYEQSRGVPFEAYLRRGIQLHINSYLRKNLDQRHDEVTALSLDAGPGDADGEDDMSLSDVVPSADPSPAIAVERNSEFSRAMLKLKPREQLFLQLLNHQPSELLAQVQQISAQARYGGEHGVKTADPNRLTSSMVFDLMGASRAERIQILRAVRGVASKLEG